MKIQIVHCTKKVVTVLKVSPIIKGKKRNILLVTSFKNLAVDKTVEIWRKNSLVLHQLSFLVAICYKIDISDIVNMFY